MVEPIEHISLGTTRVEFEHSGERLLGNAEVKLELSLNLNLRFECNFPNSDHFICPGAHTKIHLVNYGKDIPVFVIRNSLETVVFVCLQAPCTILGTEDHLISYVEFKLLNFSNLRQRHNIGFEDWSLEITAVPELPNLSQTFQNSGGFAQTHSGLLRRSDGALFKVSEAVKILDSLRLQCCFAHGIYCSPLLPTGYDPNGTEVWKEWGSSSVDIWRWAPSWADMAPPLDLSNTFPSFHEALCSGLETKNAIHVALSWYLRSNRNNGDISGGLILTQTALEGLAHHFEFRERGAARNIRSLLRKFGIPTDIPLELASLKELGRNYPNSRDASLTDGPYVFAEVRNNLVHPSHDWNDIAPIAEYEAWNLGQWYIEMTILAITGFNGKYGNRLIAGRAKYDLETVPWRKECN